jgi:predicted double-glycine peptidase
VNPQHRGERAFAHVCLILVSSIVLCATDQAAWLDVPFARQPRQGCGAAAVWMLMTYWNRAADATIEQIHQATYAPEQKGAPASAVKRYLAGRGFRVFDFAGAWTDLREQIGKGRPVIVCFGAGAQRHYVVVAGVAESHALLNDPADRKLRRIERKAMEKAWAATANWMLLAVPEPLP